MSLLVIIGAIPSAQPPERKVVSSMLTVLDDWFTRDTVGVGKAEAVRGGEASAVGVHKARAVEGGEV